MTSETTRTNKQSHPIDPGYLMMATYVISVAALVFIGWLGASSETDPAEFTPVAVVQLQR